MGRGNEQKLNRPDVPVGVMRLPTSTGTSREHQFKKRLLHGVLVIRHCGFCAVCMECRHCTHRVLFPALVLHGTSRDDRMRLHRCRQNPSARLSQELSWIGQQLILPGPSRKLPGWSFEPKHVAAGEDAANSCAHVATAQGTRRF